MSESLTLAPHPEAESMTAAEMRDAIAEAEDNLKIAREAKDAQHEAWFAQEIRLLESTLAKRNGEGKKTSQADVLIKLALESGAELFHTSTEDLFISFDVNDHTETWLIRAKATRQWLTRNFFLATKKAPSTEAMQSALALLEAKARFEGKKFDVHLRTAWCGESLYYDLCDDRWRAVEISKTGWRIIDKLSVRFTRYRHMVAQVEPEPGGNLDDLFEFVNVKSETDRKLLRAWNIVALIPDIPRPVQVLHGDQGAGKSTTARRQRELIDPSAMPLLRGRDEAEIVQGLAHHYCAIFDNLTSLPEWLSDLLSRAVTGEGFTKRQLYTDSEDVLFAYRRLLILTGIGLVVTKPDLLDRSLIISVERIPDALRKRERELDAEFQRAKPRLFGALLDSLVGGLGAYDNIKFNALPRMADFAAWSIAVETGTGRDPREWGEAYEINVERQNQEAVSASVVATALLAFLDNGSDWQGQAHELYAALKAQADEMKIPGKSFPGSAAALGRKLREIRPSLRALGWAIEFDEIRRPRVLRITRISGENAVAADMPSDRADSKDGTDSILHTYSSQAQAGEWEEV